MYRSADSSARCWWARQTTLAAVFTFAAPIARTTGDFPSRSLPSTYPAAALMSVVSPIRQSGVRVPPRTAPRPRPPSLPRPPTTTTPLDPPRLPRPRPMGGFAMPPRATPMRLCVPARPRPREAPRPRATVAPRPRSVPRPLPRPRRPPRSSPMMSLSERSSRGAIGTRIGAGPSRLITGSTCPCL